VSGFDEASRVEFRRFIITDDQAKVVGLEPWQILKKNFDRMK